MSRSIQIFILAFFSIFLFFFMTAYIPLWSSDEGRFGEIAREMLETGDYVVPHFNYVRFLDKPVLAPILSAISMHIFGVNAFAVRLPLILASLLGIGLTFLFALRLFTYRIAAFTALVLTTTVGFVLVGRFAVIDMLMTFWITLTMFSLMVANFEKKRNYYFLAYLFMGLAFLTKGLIGIVIPGMIYFFFLLWTKNLKEITKMHLFWGLLIVAAIIAPWWIAITKQIPDFFQTFIIEQHFSRFSTGTFGRRRPFWFYLPLYIAFSLPWSLFLFQSLRHGLSKQNAFQEKINFRVCWAGSVILFFSIPKSKLPYYILPASVPTALFIGAFLADWSEKKDPLRLGQTRFFKILWGILPILSITALVGINVYYLFPQKLLEHLKTLQLTLEIGLGTMTVLGIFIFFLFKQDRRLAATICLAGMIYTGLLATIYGMKQISNHQSTKMFADYILQRVSSDTIIGAMGSPDSYSDFPFYLGRQMMVVGYDRGTLVKESLKRGNEQMAIEWFPSMEEFTKRFEDRSRRAYCLVRDKYMPEFRAAGMVNYNVVMRHHNLSLLSNQVD